MKRPPKKLTFRKRKQSNRIRHQMQSSTRKGKQSGERALLKHFDPLSHLTKISQGSIALPRASESLSTDKSNEMKHQRYYAGHIESVRGSAVERATSREVYRGDSRKPVAENNEEYSFDKTFTGELQRKSFQFPSNWLYLNKEEIAKNQRFFMEEESYNTDMVRVNTPHGAKSSANQLLPTPLPLRSRTPNITWGRAHTQTVAFADPNPVNVTARDGEQARLPCTVLRLEQGEVSWIRKRDLHILTVGRTTYTSDQRFRVLHGEGSLDWTLIIGPTTLRDAGTYECQVSTKPKISRPVNLIIAVERAEIQGPKEVFIRNGSTISLTCIVKSKSEDLGSVAWTKEGVILDYDSPRGGISLEVEKTPTRATTKLFITRARKPDSGTYICSPQFAQPASVIVHVVNGEESRAVQTSNGVDAKSSLIIFAISLTLSFSSFNLQFSYNYRFPGKYLMSLLILALIALFPACHILSTVVHNRSFTFAIFSFFIFRSAVNQTFFFLRFSAIVCFAWYGFSGVFFFNCLARMQKAVSQSLMLFLSSPMMPSRGLSFSFHGTKMSIKFFCSLAVVIHRGFVFPCYEAVFSSPQIAWGSLIREISPKGR